MKKNMVFKNNQINLSGTLYFPPGFDETQTYPTVICVHPAGSVKEQSPALYAAALSAKGLVVLTFDASHQGASEGEPRYLEDPFRRVEDIRCAVDYINTLSFIHPDKLAYWVFVPAQVMPSVPLRLTGGLRLSPASAAPMLARRSAKAGTGI